MTMQKPNVIDRAAQNAFEWLHEIAERIERPDDLATAHHALRSVLHAVRDNLLPDEVMHLSSQLPTMIRGVYFEGYRLSNKPAADRSRSQFLERVERGLREEAGLSMDPELASEAVFGVLEKHLDDGQVQQVRTMLHKDVQAIWRQAA